MTKKPTLARLTMNAARNGYVTLLTWGLTNTGFTVIASATTVRGGKLISNCAASVARY